MNNFINIIYICTYYYIIPGDDIHESTYNSTFLSQFDYKTWSEGNKLRPVLWKGSRIAEKVARVPVSTFLNSVDGAKAVFQSLLDYGVVLIDGVCNIMTCFVPLSMF